MARPGQPASEWVTHPWVTQDASGVRFGIANGPLAGDWRQLAEFVARVEALGFDSYWVRDHPLTGPDCWTTLSALAATTRRIRLGPLVSCVTYRNPILLARMAADVDRISGGRLVLGLGSGDFAWEHEQLGVPWSSLRARQAMLDEAVRIIRFLWGDADAPPPGGHFAWGAPPLQAGPVQRPRIPILIAGGGERVTLRQVAEHADASNFGEHAWIGGVSGDAAVEGRLEAVRRHCAAFGRPADSVLRTHTTFPLVLAPSRGASAEKAERCLTPLLRAAARHTLVAGTPSDAVAYYRRLVGLGFRYFVAFTFDLETVELLAERVVPEIRRLAGGDHAPEPAGAP